MARDNKTIGKFRLSGIKRAPQGVPQIEVTFDIDANGILKVSARDLDTGRAQEIVITSSSNLPDSEIEAAIRDARQYADQDGLRRSAMEERSHAEQIVARLNQVLRERGRELDKREVRQLNADMATVEKAMMKVRPDKLNEDAVYQLREAMAALKRSPLYPLAGMSD